MNERRGSEKSDTSAMSTTSADSGETSNGEGKKRGRPFSHRSSHLDLGGDISEQGNPLLIFRGFFVLFWTSVAIHVISTIVRNFLRDGTILGGSIFSLLCGHFYEFAMFDAGMAASLYLTLPLNKLLVTFRVRHLGGLGTVFQHVWQSVFLSFWLKLAWHANWSWIQSGIFSLHLVAMLFKIHSFSSTNGSFRDEWLNSPENSLFIKKMNFSDFSSYLLFPTLVYELEYPRTPHIRWGYVASKALNTFAACFLIYLTLEHYVIPVISELHKNSFIFAVHELLSPIMFCYLMLFFVIFECVLNGLAELSRFADRNFYDDWWNSSTFEQFARKWNRPVHEFLLRHVYLESINTYKISKSNASAITFLFSACFHELVMIMVSGRIKFYLFILQMLQLPLIYLGNLPIVRRHPIFGNAFFWVSMYCGPPLLTVSYCWEFFAHSN